MGGGPSRGTGPIHCEEVAELLGEHYYDEAWRVFEKVSSHRKDAHGQFIVGRSAKRKLARAFANDMLVRYGDDPQKAGADRVFICRIGFSTCHFAG